MRSGAKKLNDMFNIDNVKDVTKESELIDNPEQNLSENNDLVPYNPSPPIVQEEFKDSNKIRKQIDSTIDKAQQALDIILEEHIINPSGRNAEATAKLVESITKLTATLLDLNHREKEITNNSNKDFNSKGVTNNTLVIGTSELLDRIIQAKLSEKN